MEEAETLKNPEIKPFKSDAYCQLKAIVILFVYVNDKFTGNSFQRKDHSKVPQNFSKAITFGS
jgi:hypothetical protein